MTARDVSKLRWPEDEPLTGTDSEGPVLRTIKSNARLYYEVPWRRPLILGTISVLTIAGVMMALVFARRNRSDEEEPSGPRREMMQRVFGIEPLSSGAEVEEEMDIMDADVASGRPSTALFHDPEVQEVATESIMLVGGEILQRKDRHFVRAAVATGFRNMSVEIESRASSAWAQLEQVRLNTTQVRAVLGMMRLLGDERVRSIGVDVGEAIYDCGSSEAKVVQMAVEAKLKPRIEEIKNLRDELVPEALRQIWRDSYKWEMTLDPENVRIMGPYHRGKFAALSSSNVFGVQKVEETPFTKTVYGVLGGILEEGRALIHIIGLIAHLHGHEVSVPTWVTALGGNLAVTNQDLNCEHEFSKDIEIKLMKGLFCPLKFGTMGIDAMRTLSEVGEGFAR